VYPNSYELWLRPRGQSIVAERLPLQRQRIQIQKFWAYSEDECQPWNDVRRSVIQALDLGHKEVRKDVLELGHTAPFIKIPMNRGDSYEELDMPQCCYRFSEGLWNSSFDGYISGKRSHCSIVRPTLNTLLLVAAEHLDRLLHAIPLAYGAVFMIHEPQALPRNAYRPVWLEDQSSWPTASLKIVASVLRGQTSPLKGDWSPSQTSPTKHIGVQPLVW